MSKKAFEHNTNSAGILYSDEKHLDSHFMWCEPEYSAILRSVNLQAGDHVLDAGCGVGSYISLIAEEIGANGKINAIDLASENIANTNARVEHLALPQAISTQLASVTELPFENDYFNAVWSANVVQYLTDEELGAMLRECYRVVKPGGKVAIKEFDGTITMLLPGDPTLITRVRELARHAGVGGNSPHGTLRAPNMIAWLDKAGFSDITMTTTIIERRQPKHAYELEFLKEYCLILGKLADSLDLSEADFAALKQLADIDSENHILKDPNFYCREGAILAVGQVPQIDRK